MRITSSLLALSLELVTLFTSSLDSFTAVGLADANSRLERSLRFEASAK